MTIRQAISSFTTTPLEPWSPRSPSWDPAAAALPADTWDLLRRMPKAELHLHLDGSLRLATALELAGASPELAEGSPGLAESSTKRAEASPETTVDVADLPVDVADRVDWIRRRLVGPPQAADQLDLLRAFDLPIALMQTEAALTRITAELVEDVAADGTRYAEIRWAPTLHLDRLSLAEGIGAVVRGAEEGTRRAPEVAVRLIAVVLRSHAPELGVSMAETAARFVDRGLTGFDLAGQEQHYPDPQLHGRAFAIAREAGLGITIHAGEWGGAAQVWRALEVDPARIAHGAPAGDDPALQRELRDRGVTLDLCPTSNTQAAIVPAYSEHPLPRLLRAGVPVTLSTDDRTVSDLSLVREYARAHASLGLTLPELWAMDRHALEVAFLQHDEALRASLLAEFDAFATGEPALAVTP